MQLTEEQARWCLYAARDLIARRTLGGQPIPAGIHHLHQHLAASAHGNENATGSAELTPEPDELIDSEQAADILNVTTRRVRQLNADLEGSKMSGRWVFNRATVETYAEGRNT